MTAPTPTPEQLAEFQKKRRGNYDELARERGGVDGLGITSKACLRKLSRLLASGSVEPRVLNAITSLQALIPPVVARPVEQQPELSVEDLEKDLPWDLAKLDDAQFALLQELHALATGRALPVRNERRAAQCRRAQRRAVGAGRAGAQPKIAGGAPVGFP